MENVFFPDHIHFLATCTLEKPKTTVVSSWLRWFVDTFRYSLFGVRPKSHLAHKVQSWLTRLVYSVDMQVLAGPMVVECSDLGNEGVTGLVMLSTSHCSMHIWDQMAIPYLTFDLYSCKRFSVATVLEMLREFDIRVCDYQVIDRNHANEDELVAGSMFRICKGNLDFRSYTD